MGNTNMNMLRASMKKKEVARLVLYSELSKYYTAEEIDQLLDDILIGARNIKNNSIKFSHLSTNALVGIKDWLEDHPGPTPPGPTPTTFNIYFGFANPAEIEGIEVLEVREAEELAGEYDVTNERDGNQFYMVLPSNIILENGQLKIKDNPFYFPTKVDTTLEIDGRSYTRYITNGDDLGYKAGFYPFVIK